MSRERQMEAMESILSTVARFRNAHGRYPNADDSSIMANYMCALAMRYNDNALSNAQKIVVERFLDGNRQLEIVADNTAESKDTGHDEEEEEDDEEEDNSRRTALSVPTSKRRTRSQSVEETAPKRRKVMRTPAALPKRSSAELRPVLHARNLENWPDKYQVVADFVARHHRLPREIASDDFECGFRANSWIRYQRARYAGKKGNALTRTQIRKLEMLSTWTWSTSELKRGRWQRRYDELLTWMRTHDNRFPSERAIDGEERLLGNFVKTQKQRFHGTASTKLSNSAIVQLEQVPGWRWHSSNRNGRRSGRA